MTPGNDGLQVTGKQLVLRRYHPECLLELLRGRVRRIPVIVAKHMAEVCANVFAVCPFSPIVPIKCLLAVFLDVLQDRLDVCKAEAFYLLSAIVESEKGPAPEDMIGELRKPAADPDAAKAQRDSEAHQRAQQQNRRAQAQATEQATRAAANADRAAHSRVKHEQALQAAEERRARVEKSRADALAQGRKPAAPLPAPAASTPVR